MKTYAPTYYKEFKCISSQCKHNCCIGWEIDIDANTLELYNNLSGDLSGRIKESISLDDSPHFILDKNNRCPFLNNYGLCEIILEYGEEGLCQICSDHPRFRNCYDTRTEIGLGLCCEAACELILSKTEPFVLECIENSDNQTHNNSEAAFFRKRDTIFNILSNRNFPLENRIDQVMKLCNISQVDFGSTGFWMDFYLGLEILDDKWKNLLFSVSKDNSIISKCDFTNNSIIFENILLYLIYRNLTEAKDNYEFNIQLLFCILSLYIIATLSKNNDILEVTRMYSAEIEYSDENIDKTLDILSTYIY